MEVVIGSCQLGTIITGSHQFGTIVIGSRQSCAVTVIIGSHRLGVSHLEAASSAHIIHFAQVVDIHFILSLNLQWKLQLLGSLMGWGQNNYWFMGVHFQAS
jgi:hypothetical protein